MEEDFDTLDRLDANRENEYDGVHIDEQYEDGENDYENVGFRGKQ